MYDVYFSPVMLYIMDMLLYKFMQQNDNLEIIE